MKKCFGYVRVSTQKQGEGVSLEAQRDAIDAYAKRNDILISRWFEEKVTAAKSGRPVFTAMVKDLIKGRAQGLVLHKIDRGARNFADWAKIGDLSDAGIDVHFATETLDFRSRGGRLSADIQAVIAADYIRNLREETMKGMRGRLKQGLCPWGAPLGYQNNGGGKVKTIDPLVAPGIKHLFELYASGQHSLQSLVVEARRSGFRTSAGRILSKHAIEAIFSNPFYCGVLKVKSTGETYAGSHSPIISAALYETVQAVKLGKAGKKIAKHEFLYRGLFHCAECARKITPEQQKGHVYYRCHTVECATAVREESIDAAVDRLLAGLTFTDADLQAIEQSLGRSFNADAIDAERHALTVQIDQTKERLSRLADAFIDRHIDELTFHGKQEAAHLELRRLEEQHAGAQDAGAQLGNAMKFLELVRSIAALYGTSKPADKRIIVDLATSNRWLDRKDVVLEPSDWLVPVKNAVAVGSGDPSRPTLRMSKQQVMPPIVQAELTAEQVRAIFTAANSGPAAQLLDLLDDRSAAHDTKFKSRLAAQG